MRSLTSCCVWLLLAIFHGIEAFAPSRRHISTQQRSPSTTGSGTALGADASSSSSSTAAAAATSSLFRTTAVNGLKEANVMISPLKAALVKAGMIAYIVGMCLALPATLLPQKLLYKLGIIGRTRKERWAVSTTQFCSRWMLRLVPFCTVNVIVPKEVLAEEEEITDDPQPAVWVCNHQSMLDVFVLLAADLRLRGPNKRPIKIVYWKGLETNPVTALMFRQAGFISVDMEGNKHGEGNEYDKGSFKKLLKECKTAFDEGFDIALLPEGQPNPTPEKGLLPVFGGAYTLARMSRRPIHMMALHGVNKLWHPNDNIGMTVTDNRVTIRHYPYGRYYNTADEFKETFTRVVGHFGATGKDLPNWEALVKGEAGKR